MGVWLLIYFFDHQTVHIPDFQKRVSTSPTKIETQLAFHSLSVRAGGVGLV